MCYLTFDNVKEFVIVQQKFFFFKFRILTHCVQWVYQNKNENILQFISKDV